MVQEDGSRSVYSEKPGGGKKVKDERKNRSLRKTKLNENQESGLSE